MQKEANAHIKINKLLEEAGWRFFDDASSRANVVLKNNVKVAQQGFPADRLSMNDYRAVGKSWLEKVPEYVKDYVPLNQFMN